MIATDNWFLFRHHMVIFDPLELFFPKIFTYAQFRWCFEKGNTKKKRKKKKNGQKKKKKNRKNRRKKREI